jgi:hypothetical protein
LTFDKFLDINPRDKRIGKKVVEYIYL